MFAAISCTSLQVSNAITNTTAVSYQTFVNVTCQTGYQFTADQYWVVTQCQADTQWLPQLQNCTREYEQVYTAIA